LSETSGKDAEGQAALQEMSAGSKNSPSVQVTSSQRLMRFFLKKGGQVAQAVPSVQVLHSGRQSKQTPALINLFVWHSMH
jgi:hypothetical protein